jgi:hypothetical protein
MKWLFLLLSHQLEVLGHVVCFQVVQLAFEHIDDFALVFDSKFQRDIVQNDRALIFLQLLFINLGIEKFLVPSTELFVQRHFLDLILDLPLIILLDLFVVSDDLLELVLALKIGDLEFFVALIFFHEFLELVAFFELKAVELEQVPERLVLFREFL